MKSSIYISSEKIEVIGYAKSGKRVLVKEYAQAPLPEGAMINGMITDHGALVDVLKALSMQHPALFTDATLLADGSSILSKRVPVPKLRAWQYDSLIRDEFANTTENPDNLICGYQKLGGKPESILAVAVDQGQVESYIATCRDAGVKLAAIRVGVQAILNFVATNHELQKQTFVLNIIEGVSVMSMVFDNGVNVFMSRTRLYSENQEQFVQSMHSSLSGLMQFNASQKLGRITHSYYLGLQPADLQAIREANPDPSVRFEALSIFSRPADAERLPPDVHLVYLGALLGEGSVDLARSYRALDKIRRKQKPKKRWIAGMAALVVVLLIPIGFLAYQNIQAMGDIAEVNDYLNDPERVGQSIEIDIVTAKTGQINRVNGQLSEKENAEENVVRLTKGMLDLVTNSLGKRVTVQQIEYTAASGYMRISALARYDDDPAFYVQSILDRAVNIAAYGVSSASTSGFQATGGGYSFNADIYFYAKAQPEPELEPDPETEPSPEEGQP